MKVFLSWSGERSRAAAELLRRWLSDVVQRLEPWMSRVDIAAGAPWSQEVRDSLANSAYGILCITRTNTEAPWLLFEAGALAKAVPGTAVCPYLVGLRPEDLPAGPLTQFQAKCAVKEDTWELVVALNVALKEHAIEEAPLRRSFDRWWPDLEQGLNQLPPDVSARPTKRSPEAIAAETLEVVRRIARSLEGQAKYERALEAAGLAHSPRSSLHSHAITSQMSDFIKYFDIINKLGWIDADVVEEQRRRQAEANARAHSSDATGGEVSGGAQPPKEGTD